MAKKPLRSQLNQIRAWVQQGRTDAWIAHQLEVSTSELREFRRRHELSADEESGGEIDLRDEIEAEIEAAMDADEEEDEADDEEDTTEADEEEDEEPVDDEEPSADRDDSADASDGDGGADGRGSGREPSGDGEDDAPKRRRRRRGGRGRGRAKTALEASFDHGEKDGYGLWLDPAVKDDPVYAEHWAGHREVEVSVQPEQIVIKRI